MRSKIRSNILGAFLGGSLFFCPTLFATIYLTAFEPTTQTIGMAYSSSGANFWQTRIKNHGMVGEQAYGLCNSATPETFLSTSTPATEVKKRLVEQCNDQGWHRYRLAIVMSDGTMDSHIAYFGCHALNKECGQIQSENFMVVGGGLEENVLESANKFFHSLSSTMPLACRLLLTLNDLYEAGGEKKPFKGASISIDAPHLEAIKHWQQEGSENELIFGLQQQMRNSYQCHLK